MISKWLNSDGSLNTTALDDIEASLKATTDRTGGLMDIVTQKGYLPAFVCNHSGLLFPGNYIKQWGRDYGIGLGRDPVSEVLDTDYHTDPPDMRQKGIKRIEQITHPVGPCFAQVDRVMLPPSAFKSSAAILDGADTDMVERMKIILPKQLENSTQLRVLHTHFAKGRG